MHLIIVLTHFVIISVLIDETCAVLIEKSYGIKCNQISKRDLTKMLGAGYNSRYMSVTEPKEETGRTDNNYSSFYVDENFSQELDEEIAWFYPRRRKRSAISSNRAQTWQCPYKIVWIDLGINYFPQYVRSVQCLAKNCWYTHFKCKPRSFTLQFLRRKENLCERGVNNLTSVDVISSELTEVWVLEERAVTFCCDCSL